jgi:YVTN family beta-propeller protein
MKKILIIFAVAFIFSSPIAKSTYQANNNTIYSYDADFVMGTLLNVNFETMHDQIRLNNSPSQANFLWVAASKRGTILKIDTLKGIILGEYLSAPNRRGRDPSRTTVDNNGNLWAGNRAESGSGKGSFVEIGLSENFQCFDRNSNGKIDTSQGLGDILNWSNENNADSNGGVSTSEDECIIKYVRTNATGVRTIAIDENNYVWIGGKMNRVHELYDSNTGELINGTRINFGCGGYGGLLDNKGVLWSSSGGDEGLLRYDPKAKVAKKINVVFSYGLAKDSFGNIWNSQYDERKISKFSEDGTLLGQYPTGGDLSRGVAVTDDNDVWIANSGSNTVTRLYNNGTLKATIPVGTFPTGVAVDLAGKVWVTDRDSDDVMRIDPFTNKVDLTVYLGKGAGPYDYSDMTGRFNIAPPNRGSWTIVKDSGSPDARWTTIGWNASVPGNSIITVKAATSKDGINFGPLIDVANNGALNLTKNRYLKVVVLFDRDTDKIRGLFGPRPGKSPILYDLTISQE